MNTVLEWFFFLAFCFSIWLFVSEVSEDFVESCAQWRDAKILAHQIKQMRRKCERLKSLELSIEILAHRIEAKHPMGRGVINNLIDSLPSRSDENKNHQPLENEWRQDG